MLQYVCVWVGGVCVCMCVCVCLANSRLFISQLTSDTNYTPNVCFVVRWRSSSLSLSTPDKPKNPKITTTTSI